MKVKAWSDSRLNFLIIAKSTAQHYRLIDFFRLFVPNQSLYKKLNR